MRPRLTLPQSDDSDTVVRQMAVFVPKMAPFDRETWAEGVLGNVIRSLTSGESCPSWFWFSRYALPSSEMAAETTPVPRSFATDGLFRSVRFRYAISADVVQEFEGRANALTNDVGARMSDVRDYDWLQDLGADRFAGAAPLSQRTDRARLVAEFLWSTCRLALNCLTGPDERSRYRFEENFSRSNPHSSPFESLHHLFCNITAVPTSVLVNGDHVGTHWTPPPFKDSASEKRVWF